MGKSRKPPDEGGKADAEKKYSVIIEPEILPQLKYVAESLGQTPPAYINQQLIAAVERDFQSLLEKKGYEPKRK